MGEKTPLSESVDLSMRPFFLLCLPAMCRVLLAVYAWRIVPDGDLSRHRDAVSAEGDRDAMHAPDPWPRYRQRWRAKPDGSQLQQLSGQMGQGALPHGEVAPDT